MEREKVIMPLSGQTSSLSYNPRLYIKLEQKKLQMNVHMYYCLPTLFYVSAPIKKAVVLPLFIFYFPRHTMQ